MKVKYYLKDKEAKNSTMILMAFSYKSFGKSFRLRCSTKLSITPRHWNEKNQLIKSSSADSVLVNHRLREIEKYIHDCLFELEKENITASPKILQERLFDKIEGRSIATENFFEFAESYYQNSIKIGKSKGRIKHIKSFIKILRNYESYSCRNLDFHSFDTDFYEQFYNYRVNIMKVNSGTFGSNISILKAILNDATDREVNKNLAFRSKTFKRTTSKSESIYLTREEINKISELKLEGEQKKIRDLFLIGTETGLRFSDYSTINKEDIDFKENKLSVITQKTKQRLRIPLSNILKKILLQYPDGLPKSPTNQVSNRQLKKIGALADIKKEVSLLKNREGKDISITEKKHQFIETHTGRRSFATNLYLKGVPPQYIMKFTGHATERSFFQYIKVDNDTMNEKVIEVFNSENY